AMIGARRAWLPEVPFDLLVLAADPARQPDSSLGHMMGLFAAEARERDPEARVAFVLEGDHIDTEALERAVAAAAERARVMVICGTSFAFVFAEDVLARRFTLPQGSRAMYTGGFKGRSRVLDEAELRAAIGARFGLADDHLVTEYGMTELSSQLWSRQLLARAADDDDSLLWVPPWVRVTAVDPASLEPVADGERGILRFDDAANLDSCVSIQTADVGLLVHTDRGLALRLFGRDPTATPRGCSLAIEEALARGSSP
ncbi:MAG: acyl-protein synthetase, partial [Deltaproteobacteria bacterium]